MADNLRDVLLAIRERRGILTPEVVVQEAMDPSHPLHHRFEWNDGVAAHKYRLSQASELLRVTYRSVEGTPRDLRAFWVTKGPDGSGENRYEPIEEVVADPISRRLLLQQMRRDWQVFKARYEHMEEFVTEVLGRESEAS